MNAHDAELAMCLHGVQLAAFARGEQPPVLVDERHARLICDGMDALLALRDDAARCVREFAAFEQRERDDKLVCLDAVLDIAGQLPALEKWRSLVLTDRKRTRLERVAAWELTALECAGRGEVALYRSSIETARALAAPTLAVR